MLTGREVVKVGRVSGRGRAERMGPGGGVVDGAEEWSGEGPGGGEARVWGKKRVENFGGEARVGGEGGGE